MRIHHTFHLGKLAWVAVAAAALGSPAQAQDAYVDNRPQCTDQRMDTLEGRNCAFLHAGYVHDEFLPRTGTFTWYQTSYKGGPPILGVWRFAPADIEEAATGEEPLHDVFGIDVEGTRIGSLSHQAMHLGTAWRRVPGNRFVPPGAPDDSPVFVQWRREGARWVVAAVGDETYGGDAPLPPWCC